jgi:hypothetical protein
MFVQVIQGKVGDAAGLARNMDRWETELKPNAVGFIGSTAGTTKDGTFIALARFESADAAQANGDKPEQSSWWAETEKCFDGDVSFLNCDGQLWGAGGSDDAGFVQVMQGQSNDVARLKAMMADFPDDMNESRPDVIGGVFGAAEDGHWVQAVYFTSEQAAREGETKEMTEAQRAQFEEAMSLMGEVSYLDLSEPRLISA